MLLITLVVGLSAPADSALHAASERSTAVERVAETLKKLTLDEKLSLLHGAPGNYTGNTPEIARLGIPAIRMNDGPQGFRSVPVSPPGTSTAWPCALAIAATWDVASAAAWGAAMGDEFYRKGANVQLGPGLCIARVPRNGRNFEYISGEDPVLGRVLARPAIEGIQGERVVANAKHWVANNQETERQMVDEIVDERTRFELYYPPFEGAIEANVGSFMCSYNRVNGHYSCENPETLQHDLKDVLGFKGWVMSDWGATHSLSLGAGLDQEMPANTSFGPAAVRDAINAGNVSIGRVDEAVSRILTPFFAVGAFDTPNPNSVQNNVSTAAHTQLARELAARSIVLLKNDGDVLPLSVPAAGLTVACIGNASKSPIVAGGGSGHVIPAYVSAPFDAIRDKLGIAAEECNSNATRCCSADVCLLYSDGGSDARAVATKATVALVFGQTSSHEAADRASLKLDGDADALIAAVATYNPRTVACIVAPGAVLTPWRKTVAAATLGFMPGQQYGNALADVLFGDVAPSAKLPLTLPSEGQEPLTPDQWPGQGEPLVANYTERLLVGYRFYDAKGLEPAFPFGHGLSYTRFWLSDLSVSPDLVHVTVTNTGSHFGVATPQLYLTFPESAGEPPKLLKGFMKLKLLEQQALQASFQLSKRDRSIWDASLHAWIEVAGLFRVTVGLSSRDEGALVGSFEI